MYSKIVENFLLPIYQINLPKEARISTMLKFYKRSQCWDIDELKKYQLKKLRELLIHANNNVPFYRKMFNENKINPSEIKSTDDLSQLPIINKDIINENLKNLLSKNYKKNELIKSMTGGSSGNPLNFYIDRNWMASNMGAAYRSWSWAGYHPGNKMLYLWGAQRDLKKPNKIGLIRDKLLRVVKLNAFRLTNQNMAEYAKIINKFKPKIINSYSSSIFTFAEYIHNNKIELYKPNAILTTADMISEQKRNFVRDVFNCELLDYYSGRETSFQAAECPEHNGYHMAIENAVVEFLKDGKPVSPGEPGKIVITDLTNYATPLIRYEIGDIGIPSDENCSCGIKLPLMKSVKGRILDNIITPDGKNIGGVFFRTIIAKYNFSGIKRYQIIQTEINQLLMKIVIDKRLNKVEFDKLLKVLKSYFGEDMEIKVVFVDKIKPNKSGKFIPVISKINR